MMPGGLTIGSLLPCPMRGLTTGVSPPIDGLTGRSASEGLFHCASWGLEHSPELPRMPRILTSLSLTSSPQATLELPRQSLGLRIPMRPQLGQYLGHFSGITRVQDAASSVMHFLELLPFHSRSSNESYRQHSHQKLLQFHQREFLVEPIDSPQFQLRCLGLAFWSAKLLIAVEAIDQLAAMANRFHRFLIRIGRMQMGAYHAPI